MGRAGLHDSKGGEKTRVLSHLIFFVLGCLLLCGSRCVCLLIGVRFKGELRLSERSGLVF